jgi:DNA (cytosine-5)-methyltransferase 1
MNDDNNTKQPILNHLSLCTGYEGIGQGLRRVLPTLREIAYSEIEDYAIANLVAKIEEGRLHPAPIFTNLKTLPFREFLGKVSILSGGFPCQPFSQAGLRKATDDPRHLYPFIAEGISQCKPAFVFLENVQGIISAKTHEGESVLHYVCRDLESRGYKVSWGVFSAEECGFPHQRKRVFILGVSNTERSRMRGGRSSEECGDDTNRFQSNEREWHNLWSETEGCSGDIPNTTGGRRGQDMWRQDGKPRLVDKKSETRVARPNEPQHEWEAPRVIEVKSKLGGTINGTTYRNNRLRLLGNGVVPQVAAKAFKTLLQKNLTT